MLGETDQAMKTIHNFHQVWKQYGFTPEYYNIPKNEAHKGREGYPLRPGMELYQNIIRIHTCDTLILVWFMVILWQSVLLVEEPEKTAYLSQVTDKLLSV